MSEKRKIANFDEETMQLAVLQVVKKRRTIRGVAKAFNLSYATLRQYVTKYNAADEEERKSLRFVPNYEVNLIFSDEMEEILEHYLIAARKLLYSLTVDDVRRLSYELAMKHHLKIPSNWKVNKKAGKCWLSGYLQRHPVIKNMINLSKKRTTPVTSSCKVPYKIRPDEFIVPDDNIEEFIQSETEDVDECSKPVIIIPMKKEKFLIQTP